MPELSLNLSAYKMKIAINIPEESWVLSGPDDDRSARLLACLTINGCLCHLEAYEVVFRDGVQSVSNPTFESNFNGMWALGSPDKPFQTVTIKGREYVLAMTPYC